MHSCRYARIGRYMNNGKKTIITSGKCKQVYKGVYCYKKTYYWHCSCVIFLDNYTWCFLSIGSTFQIQEILDQKYLKKNSRKQNLNLLNWQHLHCVYNCLCSIYIVLSIISTLPLSPWWLNGKESAYHCRRHSRHEFNP